MALKWWAVTDIVGKESETTRQKAETVLADLQRRQQLRREQEEAEALESREAREKLSANWLLSQQRVKAADELKKAGLDISEANVSYQIRSGGLWAQEYAELARRASQADREAEVRKEAEHDAKIDYAKTGKKWNDLYYADQQGMIDDLTAKYLAERYPDEYGTPTPEEEVTLPTVPTTQQVGAQNITPGAGNVTPTTPTILQPMPTDWTGSRREWIEQQLGRELTFSEVHDIRDIPELGKRYSSLPEARTDIPFWTVLATTSEGAIEHIPVKDYFTVFGQSLQQLPKQTAATVLQATQGQGGASVVNRDWVDKYIAEANEDMDKFVQDIATLYPESAYLVEVAQLSRNLAYSITSMGAGLATGVPIALIPLPGARVAAWAVGTAASGAVAYQMTCYQIMQQYLELKNAEKIKQIGRGLTLEEENKLKQDFSDKATQYGLWEAIPEAIGNLAFGQLLIGPLGKMIGGPMAAQILTKIAGIYGEELLTETITQKGQSAIEVEAGLREERIGWVEAFKEIAPQTFLLTTVMAGAGQVIISSTQGINKIKASLKNEVGENHPLYEEIKQGIETEVGEVFEAAKPEITPTEVTGEVTPVTPEVTKPAEIPTEGKIIPEVIPEVAETTTAAERETTTGEVPGTIASTAGWETVTWQSSQLESGKWTGQLVGEKSKITLEQKEFGSKPTQKDFKALENTLKKQKEIRYDPKTGKYLRVRKTITHITKVDWNALSSEERSGVITSAGLDEKLATKSWDALSLAEKTALKASGITLPSIAQAQANWNKLSVAEKEALIKVLGLEDKVNPRAWLALSKKETKYLRDAVISRQALFTKDEAETAVVVNLNQAVKSKDVVYKLTQLVKLAEPIREITKGLKHEELVKRVGRATAILEATEGREAFEQSKAALKGALPEVDITPIEPGLTEVEVKELFEMIRQSDLRYFTKLNTNTALIKLLSGKIPTDSELELLERMYGAELGEVLAAKRGKGKQVWDTTMSILNLPRAILASFDLSAPLRQGALLFWGQPKQAVPALLPMVKAFVSEKNAGMIDEIINSGKYAELRREAGLYIAPLGEATPRLRQREEAFMTTLAKYIPLISHSERAYVTYLNKLRADVFDFYAEQWEEQGKTMEDYKSFASAINIMTGRGPLGKLTGVGDILNVAFFSPRYIASRVMLPVEFVRTTPTVRKIMARNILAFVASNLLMLSLVVIATRSSDEPADVEFDPRSSDFGKLKIGNTRIDFWAGFQQYARFVSQLITGVRKSSTSGQFIESKRYDLIEWFARSKASPVAGLAIDLLKGETYLGDEFSLESDAVKEQAFNRLVPMFVQDMVEAIVDAGMAGGAMALPALFGVGVQTYGGTEKSDLNEISQRIFGKNFNELNQNELDWFSQYLGL